MRSRFAFAHPISERMQMAATFTFLTVSLGSGDGPHHVRTHGARPNNP
jgi:hypothetical protein